MFKEVKEMIENYDKDIEIIKKQKFIEIKI